MNKKIFSKKQTREIAIEFAKYLMTLELSKMDKTNNYSGTVSYHPMEFDLMHGELNVHGKQIFQLFVDSFEE